MSSFVVLALLVLVAAVWFGLRQRTARSRDRADKPFSPDLERGLRTIEATAQAFLEGRTASADDLRVSGLAVQALYRHFSVTDGTDDNARFSPQHRASFYLYAIKVSALDHPDHNAWPLMASIRRGVLKSLMARPGAEQDAWVKLARITPLLLRRDVELAAKMYSELPARLASVARAWVLETVIGYKDFNDEASSLEWLEQTRVAMPTLPADDPFDAARRWAISVAVHPSYARDARLTLEDPLPAAVCRLSLESWWDITDAESALTTLTWLQDVGHRDELDEALLAAPQGDADERARFVAKHADALEAHGILAWDLCRLVQVARTSAKAGYVSEEQAWTFILSAAQALQQEYSSWMELGEDYLLGNRFFANGDEPDLTHRASVRWLERAPESPWQHLPWELPLD
jgi:hypothetical protein